MKHTLALLLLLTACQEALPDSAPDRRAVLVGLADSVILPTNLELVNQANAFQTACENLCTQANAASLAMARNAWRTTRAVYKRSEAYQIGPMDDLRKDRDIDFWPIRKGDIEAVLSATDTLDVARIRLLGSTARGLPVLEYLLFPEGQADNDLLAELVDEDGATRRCNYIVGLSRVLQEDVTLVHNAWDPLQGNFYADFTLANHTTYNNAQHALDAVVNELIFLVEMMEGTKLALPLGKRNNGVAQPRSVESFYSQNSVADLQSNTQGIKDVYLAAGATSSLSKLLFALNPALDQAMQEQLVAVHNALVAVGQPLSSAVVDQPATVEPAFNTTKDLLRLLAADVAGQLGVTSTFNDNDGD